MPTCTLLRIALLTVGVSSSTVLANAALTDTAFADAGSSPSYVAPPLAGEILVAGRELMHCDSERGARYMAETGFFAVDCRWAARGSAWRVLDRRHLDLADGGLWLLEVSGPDGAEGRGWIPLPWHDWA